MENSVDPTHTYYLHSHNLKLKGPRITCPFTISLSSKIEFDLVIQPNWAGFRNSEFSPVMTFLRRRRTR